MTRNKNINKDGARALKILSGVAAIAALPLFGCAEQTDAQARGDNVVQIESGKARGAVSGGVLSLKGIPFAAPPVGDLRWRAPQPAAPWDGVFDATEYGNDCMQVPFPSDAAPLGTEPAEDCLVLNVWRPATLDEGAALPVLVWIYGGGFVNGGSSPDVYDGSAFAENGVVFVSFNYRVGRFGFFAHPALTAAGEGPLVNYGYMDQIAALEWVQRNISRFGGDPDQVTIMGESAGGASVLNLMTTPAAKGLFDRAIVMSGGGRSTLGSGRALSEDAPNEPSAETVGVNFARGAGVEGTGPEALAALRALPAETVRGDLNMMALFAPPEGPPTYVGGPVVDGEIVVGSPDDLLAADPDLAMPLMIGATSQDAGFAFFQTKDALFESFGAAADRARTAFDPDGDRPLQAISADLGAIQFMVEPARHVAKIVAGIGGPVYYYRFSYVAESMRGEWPGAPHATEIPFFFNTVAAKYGDALTDADREAAEAMNAYVVSFAKTGAPDTDGLPAWPRFTPQGSDMMDITSERGPAAGPDPWTDKLDVVEESYGAALAQD